MLPLFALVLIYPLPSTRLLRPTTITPHVLAIRVTKLSGLVQLSTLELRLLY